MVADGGERLALGPIWNAIGHDSRIEREDVFLVAAVGLGVSECISHIA